MTFYNLERRNSAYFAFFFTEFDSFALRLCHSGWIDLFISVRKILSPSFSLPLLAKLTHPAARTFCSSWATCWNCNSYI